MSESHTKVLFVCMGNICRSPAAECFFKIAVDSADRGHQFVVESAGTGGWHAGNPPDRRMRAAAKRQGLQIQGTARQITSEDLSRFDWIFCMDQDNYEDVIEMGGDLDQTKQLLPFVGHPEFTEVPDPYYGGEDGFDDVVKLINDAVITLESMLR